MTNDCGAAGWYGARRYRGRGVRPQPSVARETCGSPTHGRDLDKRRLDIRGVTMVGRARGRGTLPANPGRSRHRRPRRLRSSSNSPSTNIGSRNPYTSAGAKFACGARRVCISSWRRSDTICRSCKGCPEVAGERRGPSARRRRTGRGSDGANRARARPRRHGCRAPYWQRRRGSRRRPRPSARVIARSIA